MPKIRVGDVLYTVDGSDVGGWELEAVFAAIRGFENTAVALELGRGGGAAEKYSLTLIRRCAYVPTAVYEHAAAATAATAAAAAAAGFDGLQQVAACCCRLRRPREL